MSAEKLLKTAAVLEKAANYIDAVEEEKRQLETEHRRKLANVLRENYKTATGEDLSDEALDKLASSDLDVLDSFNKMSESAKASRSYDLGSAGGYNAKRKPEGIKEASDQASERFLDWIVNH